MTKNFANTARAALVACGLLLSLTQTTAQAEVVDRVAAIVNNDIIAYSEVEQRAAPELARQQNEPNAKKRNEARAKILDLALDQLIGEKLLEAEMKELNLEVTEADIELGLEDVRSRNNLQPEQFEQLLREQGYTMASYREFMKKQMRRIKLINLKVRSKVKITDEELKTEYNQWARLEAQDPEVHARHILVKVGPSAPAGEVESTRKKAMAIAEEARQPGVDFAELAKQRSEGPSRAEGGDLGFFKRGVMMQEFDKVAFSMPDGSVSDPIRSKFGWHVLKVEERRAAGVKPFDEVKDELRQRVYESQLEKYTEQYVQELRSRALVEKRI